MGQGQGGEQQGHESSILTGSILTEPRGAGAELSKEADVGPGTVLGVTRARGRGQARGQPPAPESW